MERRERWKDICWRQREMGRRKLEPGARRGRKVHPGQMGKGQRLDDKGEPDAKS